MAEQIPYGIAENLLTKLGSAVFNEIGLMFGFGDELRKLEDTLSTVRAVLLDAEEKQESSHSISVWVRRLNDWVYVADDLFDDFEAEILRRKTDDHIPMGGFAGQVSAFFSSSNHLAFRFKMGHRIKAVREGLDDIANDISRFNFVPRLVSESDGPVRNMVGRDRETCSVVEKSHKIVGRHKDKKQIVDLLVSMQSSSGSENPSVVAIVGIGGLGKTTLAQLVYNDQGVSNHFDLKMWVCVSDDFNVKILVRSVIKSATKSAVPDLELDQLQHLLRQHLDEKRYFLVLDDVWNEDPKKWGQFMTLLPAGANGSKLLVTTRSRKVAAVMGIDSPYIVEGLNEKDSWDLFQSLAFRKGEESKCPNLLDIGKEIVKMCKGVPLVIETIGRMLYFKTQESQWLSVKNNRSLISLGDENDVLPVLRLSYDNLPIHLKKCFAYCALFPKDYEMEKRSLVQLWMAQGYIQPSLENECLEDVGEEYFEDLLSRSFFQEFEGLMIDRSMVDRIYYYYKIHDLIHDLAQSVAKSDIFIVADNVIPIPERVHHVSLFGATCELPKDVLDKHVRTLFMDSRSHDPYVTSRFVSRLKSSRVMKIRFRQWKVLTSLTKLGHLRYLDLSSMYFRELPSSVTRLKHLQTLKLMHCISLKELPRSMKKLINLRHLEIDGCPQLRYMPCGLGELTQLRTLTTFQVGEVNYDRRPKNSSCNRKKMLRLCELKSLNNLRGELVISGLFNANGSEAKEANLEGKQQLVSLILYWKPTWSGRRIGSDEEQREALSVLSNLRPHPNLKQLFIYYYNGVGLPNWMMDDGLKLLLPNLVRISLFGCHNVPVLPPFGQLPSLKYLFLACLGYVQYMQDYSSKPETPVLFPSLITLQIEDMHELRRWGRRDAPYSYPCLKRLSISLAPNLRVWGGSFSAAEYPSLEHLSLTGTRAKLCSHLVMRASSSLKSLAISTIQGLVSLPEEALQHLPNLQTLSIQECSNLATLPSSIGLLTKLTELTIHACPKLTSLPQEMQSLHNLLSISIKHCRSLSQRCQKEIGEDWSKISHVPNISILQTDN